MAEARGYQRQVAPRAGAPMPLARAEDYGAGLARTVEQAAGLAHREALEDYAIQRRATANEEWARFQHEFARLREDTDTVTREARKDDTPGHTARMREQLEPRRQQLLDSITEDEVRQRATAAAEEWSLRYLSGEADYEEVQRVDRTLTSWQETENLTANRIRRLERPEDYPAELQIGHDAIDGLDLPPEQARKAHENWDRVAAVSFLRGTIDRDPHLAKAMLAEGLFDNIAPDVVQQLLNASNTEIDRLAAAAEHQANVEKAAFRQDVRLAKEAAEQGIDVSDQLPDLVERAAALGLPDVALDLDGIAAESQFAKIYETVPPVQREQRMAALAGKEKRTADEDRELKWLRDKQDALDSRFNRDPAGFYARTNTPPPPMDFSDPASVAARARWARAASEVAGPVPPLTANEARQLGSIWGTGKTADQRQVLDRLAMFPPDQAAAAARLVDNDRRLAVMVALPGGYRNLALRGRDALTAKPRIIRDALKDNPDLKEQVTEFDRRFEQALRGVAPAQREAVMETATRIAAGLVDQEGGELTAKVYWNAVNMALGAVGTGPDRKGGLGLWSDSWFLLPDGVSGPAFGAAVNRAAANGTVKPVNPDKSPATLSRAVPVAIGGGLYEFRTPSGGVVMGDNGQPWRVRVRPQ